MDSAGQFIFAYLLIINIFTLVVFGWDKQQAQGGRTRVAEKRLWGLNWLGGSLGGVLGMYLFRHKTRHFKFRVGLPAILVAQAALLIYWYLG